jgi:DnaK suppressor protein
MVPADLQRFHTLLLKKRRDLSSALDEVRSRVPAAGGMAGDVIDQANADAEAELQIRLHRSDGRLARAIEDALARIKQGTYGVCEICKQPISEARLEAVPWTHLCRKCKELER